MASEVPQILASGELAALSWAVLDADIGVSPAVAWPVPTRLDLGPMPRSLEAVTQRAPVKFPPLT